MAFIGAMEEYRRDIRAAWSGDPKYWSIDRFLERMNPAMAVSPGNVEAFGYFLRSAITNEQMYMSHRVRSLKTKEQCYWHTMQSLDALADALIKAVTILKPCLEEIAHG